MATALGFRTRVGIVMIHLSLEAFGRQRRDVGDIGVPRRLGCSEVRKVGEGRLWSYSCVYWVYSIRARMGHKLGFGGLGFEFLGLGFRV